MYTLKEIQKVGWINIGGGMLAFVVGIIAQILVGFSPDRVLLGNVATYLIIGSGWFFASVLVNSPAYQKIVSDTERRKVFRLQSLDERLLPARRLKLDWFRAELVIMVAWAVSILAVQLLFGQAFTLPVGGFAGGYLAGGGLGRLRFVGKVRPEEIEQNRSYFFADTLLSSRTEIAYYTERTDDPHPFGIDEKKEPLVSTVEEATPPGVKRRPGVSSSSSKKN